MKLFDIFEDAKTWGLTGNLNPKQIDPALLTFKEYYQIANEKDKFHSDDAYSTTVKEMNEYPSNSIDNYSKILKRFKMHGLDKPSRLTSSWNFGHDHHGDPCQSFESILLDLI